MFNTAVKVAGIALIGGVTLFTAYSYIQSPSPEDEADAATPIVAEENQSASALSETEAFSESEEDLSEEERLARLGAGGMLDEDNNFDFRVAGEERSVHDRMWEYELPQNEEGTPALATSEK